VNRHVSWDPKNDKDEKVNQYEMKGEVTIALCGDDALLELKKDSRIILPFSISECPG
jgi:hypothetical protein